MPIVSATRLFFSTTFIFLANFFSITLKPMPKIGKMSPFWKKEEQSCGGNLILYIRHLVISNEFPIHFCYRVFHLRMCFLKGLKMSENQYVDKKIRQQHNHKASPFDLQPLEWILNLEDSLHSLQHLKTEVRNFAFFCDLSTATTKYLRLWRPASAFKIHSKGFKSNGEAL